MRLPSSTLLQKSKRAISKASWVAVMVVIVIAIVAGGYVALSPTPSPTTTTTTTTSRTTTVVQPSSSSTSVTASQASLTPVSFSLGIFADAYHSLIYYGYDHGIYANHGINLQISPGSGSASTIAALSSGKIDFGILDPASLILAVSTQNVTNLRIVTVLYQRTLFGVIYNSQNIKTPTDLNGKRMNDFQGNSGGVVFKVFAKLNNVNYTSVKITYTNPQLNNQNVPLGQADFTNIPIYHTVDLGVIAKSKGITLDAFPFASYGIDVYGFSIATTTQMIQNHPDVVKSVVQAIIESVVQAAHNPKDVSAALVSHNPNLNASLTLPEFEITIPYIDPNINSANPSNVGCVNTARMQATINIVNQAYAISNPAPQSSIYTNQFLQCSGS